MQLTRRATLGAAAGLIGIEYMIRSSLWETLPKEEQKYWHSHKYEVRGCAGRSTFAHSTASATRVRQQHALLLLATACTGPEKWQSLGWLDARSSPRAAKEDVDAHAALF